MVSIFILAEAACLLIAGQPTTTEKAIMILLDSIFSGVSPFTGLDYWTELFFILCTSERFLFIYLDCQWLMITCSVLILYTCT